MKFHKSVFLANAPIIKYLLMLKMVASQKKMKTTIFFDKDYQDDADNGTFLY